MLILWSQCNAIATVSCVQSIKFTWTCRCLSCCINKSLHTLHLILVSSLHRLEHAFAPTDDDSCDMRHLGDRWLHWPSHCNHLKRHLKCEGWPLINAHAQLLLFSTLGTRMRSFFSWRVNISVCLCVWVSECFSLQGKTYCSVELSRVNLS